MRTLSEEIRHLERLKVIAELNLEQSELIKDKFPLLADKYRNIVMKITMEIATKRAQLEKHGKKIKRRGRA